MVEVGLHDFRITVIPIYGEGCFILVQQGIIGGFHNAGGLDGPPFFHLAAFGGIGSHYLAVIFHDNAFILDPLAAAAFRAGDALDGGGRKVNGSVGGFTHRNIDVLDFLVQFQVLARAVR